jgi:hypothetical protein
MTIVHGIEFKTIPGPHKRAQVWRGRAELPLPSDPTRYVTLEEFDNGQFLATVKRLSCAVLDNSGGVGIGVTHGGKASDGSPGEAVRLALAMDAIKVGEA